MNNVLANHISKIVWYNPRLFHFEPSEIRKEVNHHIISSIVNKITINTIYNKIDFEIGLIVNRVDNCTIKATEDTIDLLVKRLNE